MIFAPPTDWGPDCQRLPAYPPIRIGQLAFAWGGAIWIMIGDGSSARWLARSLNQDLPPPAWSLVGDDDRRQRLAASS